MREENIQRAQHIEEGNIKECDREAKRDQMAEWKRAKESRTESRAELWV